MRLTHIHAYACVQGGQQQLSKLHQALEETYSRSVEFLISSYQFGTNKSGPSQSFNPGSQMMDRIFVGPDGPMAPVPRVLARLNCPRIRC